MTLRAADVKDEHGWQILDEDGNVVGYATSRDKARQEAKLGYESQAVHLFLHGQIQDAPGANGQVVLPADDSPEAVAARAAWDVDQRIKRNVKNLRETYIDLAADLFIFHENKMWEALGYESWDAYFADPDISLNPRWAYNQLAIYRQLVIERGVDPGRLKALEVGKVVTVLPAIRRDQVTIDEALADVGALTKSDLEAKYSGKYQPQKNQRGRPDTSTKIHTDHEPSWGRCPTCQSRVQIDPQTGEFIPR